MSFARWFARNRRANDLKKENEMRNIFSQESKTIMGGPKLSRLLRESIRSERPQEQIQKDQNGQWCVILSNYALLRQKLTKRDQS